MYRAKYRASLNLDKSTGIDEVTEPIDSAFLEQFLSNLHVFNEFTYHDNF